MKNTTKTSQNFFKNTEIKKDAKTVLITGSSTGIGLDAAKRFAEKGYIVYATVRDPKKATALQDLAKQYPNIHIKQLDVTDSELNIKSIIDSMGSIDILVNNAGVGLYGPVETATNEQIKRVFDANFFGLLNITNAVLPDMRKRNSGTIITLSSIVGPLPDPYLPFYSASKAAIETVMAVLRKDLADAGFNIKICNVQPGPVLTNFKSSTPSGSKFLPNENPYPQMQLGLEKWSKIMTDSGQTTKETVDIIIKVAEQENPDYWNPTKDTKEEYEKVYKDTTGNTYMAGITVPVDEPKNTMRSKL